MTVTVVEAAQGTNGSTGTAPVVTIATTPAAGDVVYLAVQGASNGRTITSITGLGATWSEVFTANGVVVPTSHIVWRGVGATTAGTVTVNVSSSMNGSVRAWLVRGMTVPDFTPAFVDGSTAAAVSGPVQSAGAGCFVLALGTAQLKTSGNLLEGTQPATGWVILTGPAGATAYHHTGYRVPTSTGLHQCTIAAGTNTAKKITQVVFGVAPPSGFTGWGAPL